MTVAGLDPEHERELRARFARLPAVVYNAPIPVWLQVCDRLRGRIERGELTGRLPSQEQIAESYDVSLPTVRAAARALASEGVIVRRQRGYFVA